MKETLAWILGSIRAGGWAPALVLFFHFLLATPLNLYARVPSLDSYEHLAGGIAFATFFWRSVSIPEARVLGSWSTVAKVLCTFTAVGTAAVAWEVFEWMTDRLGWTRAQFGLADTLLDMVLGITGGVVFLTAVLLGRTFGAPDDTRGRREATSSSR